jgi:cell division protein FtsQ
MKKLKYQILRMMGLATFLLVVGLLMYYGYRQRNQAECRQIDIRFSASPQLTTKEEIYHIIRRSCDTLNGFLQLSLPALEARLDTLPFVFKSEVFRTLNGTLVVNIKEREPVARLFLNDGATSVLVDEHLHIVPVRNGFTPTLPIINGHTPSSIMEVRRIFNDKALKTQSVLDDAVGFLAYIRQDAFWRAQVEQVYINADNEIEFVPRVGEQIILLGDSAHLQGKLAKLKLFYLEGLSRGGWQTYNHLNLKFKNQIICKTI